MSGTADPKRFVPALIAIVILALALRVGLTASFVGFASPPDASAQPDQLDYEAYAARMAAGEGYTDPRGEPTAFRPPGTSLTLLPAYLAFGRSWTAGRLWFCLLSAATCLLAGLLAGRAFGPLVGLLAALFLALYPPHAYSAMHFISEGPFLLWVTLATLLAWLAWRREGWLPWTLAAGLVLGLAALTRPQALLILPLAWLAALLAGRAERRGHLTRLAVLTLASSLVLGVWVGRNALVLGQPTLSTVGGCTFWGAHNEPVLNDPDRIGSWKEVTRLASPEQPLVGDEFERDRLSWQYGMAFVREHRAEMPRLLYWKLRRLFTAFAYPGNPLVNWAFGLAWILAAPLALVGLAICWRRDRLLAVMLALPLLATVATSLVFYGNVRFRQSVATMYLVPAALCVGTWLERARARRRRSADAEDLIRTVSPEPAAARSTS